MKRSVGTRRKLPHELTLNVGPKISYSNFQWNTAIQRRIIHLLILEIWRNWIKWLAWDKSNNAQHSLFISYHHLSYPDGITYLKYTKRFIQWVLLGTRHLTFSQMISFNTLTKSLKRIFSLWPPEYVVPDGTWKQQGRCPPVMSLVIREPSNFDVPTAALEVTFWELQRV